MESPCLAILASLALATLPMLDEGGLLGDVRSIHTYIIVLTTLGSIGTTNFYLFFSSIMTQLDIALSTLSVPNI
jgi:hypothetical protein